MLLHDGGAFTRQDIVPGALLGVRDLDLVTLQDGLASGNTVLLARRRRRSR